MQRLGLALLLASCAGFAQVPSDISATAERVYTFAYPLVLMEYTRRNTPVANRFTHLQQFPDDTFRQVVRPNADTLYSSAWLDLSKEPIMMHVPDTHGRFYLMQFLDAWTDTFAVPGKRTTGTAEGWFAIVGPGWKGKLPANAKRIDSPTNMVWLIGRTQTNNASDYEFVHNIQRGYFLTPLSQYPNEPPADGGARRALPAGPPPILVQGLNAADFMNTFAQLLTANPIHPADEPMIRDMVKIGVKPGQGFDAQGETLKGVQEGVQKIVDRIRTMDGRAGKPGKTGWSGGVAGGGKVGRYATDYDTRAWVARIGLGALPPEDAVYMHSQEDASGKPLSGSSNYRMHFEKGQTPPVNAFWSVTMYSNDGYFIANPIRRYAIGDRDPLRFNPDGSLDLYIQHDAPGGDKDANWLPTPSGRFNLSLRLYWPSDDVVSGKWIPPAVEVH